MYPYIRRGGLVIVALVLLTFFNILSFYPERVDEPHGCIVVFGAAVWPGEFGPEPSDALRDRALEGAHLYHQGLSQCVVLSGANSVYGAHEVDLMTDILLDEGVPLSAITLDRDGINTAATIAHLDPVRSYILVSNDFHLARIGLLSERAGLTFSLDAAPYTNGRYRREPYFVFREMGAWWYYFFATLL